MSAAGSEAPAAASSEVLAPGLSDSDLLLRAARIEVADLIVQAESQVQEIRRGYHGLDAESAGILRAHLTSAVAVVRRGLQRRREDAALALETRFPGLYLRRGGAAAREGIQEVGAVVFTGGSELRPRAAIGAAAEVVQAVHRNRTRQTLAEARETRLLFSGVSGDYVAPAEVLQDIREARALPVDEAPATGTDPWVSDAEEDTEIRPEDSISLRGQAPAAGSDPWTPEDEFSRSCRQRRQ